MFGYKKHCNVAFIGNYLPRICGIATFTSDLLAAVEKQFSSRSNLFAIAMNDEGRSYDYPSKVLFSINQSKLKDYLEAANIINTSNAQVACLQHEFGIFGGEDGEYILSLLSKLTIPLVTTFHTVLMTPRPNQKRIMTEISKYSAKLIVMSDKSKKMLKNIYNVPEDKIEMIFHGTPNFSSIDSSPFKKRFKLEGKKMILTFGLLSPNKGIETVIRALPPLIKDFPDITYVVLGKTHPHVYKEHGDRYRESLVRLVEKLKLQSHVIFDERFVSIEELYAWLQASDIYVTPYMNKAQAVSGTLSYAIGAGNAILSTPYWHAEEVLADGRGYLFDFNDSEKLSSILRELLQDEKKLKALQKKTYNYGRQMRWDVVSAKYADLFLKVSSYKRGDLLKYAKSSVVMRIPPFDLKHLKRLTDDTGIIQHAKYIIPERSTGYCLDDNARALMVAAWAVFLFKDEQAKELLTTYCSFVRYMQRESGGFANFFSYTRDHLEEEGSDDSNGRAIWALGFLAWKTSNKTLRSFSSDMITKSLKIIPKLNLRGKAFSAMGLVCYIRAFGSDDYTLDLLKNVTKDILEAYYRNSDGDWKWFEGILCYDNAVMPMALFNSFSILNDEKILEVAKESLSFLEKNIFKGGMLSIIGNNGWYTKGEKKAQFDQQPIDAAAVVLAMQSAYRITKDKEYLVKMRNAFDWFLGENDLSIPMYDIESKGCSDGLMKEGISMNQGAESTISFLLAQLAINEEYEIENLE
ncbi:MAG: glycosyltransferase [Proteobacteria bacterium]|nr:glycosyltransferase [Pseudomonadota bacterium]